MRRNRKKIVKTRRVDRLWIKLQRVLLKKDNIQLAVAFYFLITYGVCKKRKYCNRMSEKKNSPFDKCSCFVCFRRQNKQKKISVCLSVCLSVRTYVDIITFEGVSGSKQNLVDVFYV